MTPRLNLAGIIVSDMARSLAFYRRLGLTFPPDADSSPHVEVEIGSGFKLAWDSEEVIKSFDATWVAPTGGKRISFACECADPAEVNAVYAQLVAAGYVGELEPWDAVWGQRYASVLDPDGNGVDLYAGL